MKTNPNSSQDNQQSQNQDNDSQPPKPLTSSQCHFDQLQIDQTLHLLEKIKKIHKRHYTELKSKNKKFNRLFAVMSEFFINPRKKNIQKKNQEKYKRIQSRKKKLLSNYNKFFNFPNQNPQIQMTNEKEVSENQNFCFSQRGFIPRQKVCYVCRLPFSILDSFYLRHCPSCSTLSRQKRFQSVNLANLTALVTGSRIKIGYEITLKLLRDGATVYATTRFTNDALFRYQKQSDYEVWKNRLFLIQCDFLSSKQVGDLIEYIKKNVKHLDILIHNAAQTLTRPVEFYTFQLKNQQKALSTSDSNRMIKFEDKSFPSILLQSNQSQSMIQSSLSPVQPKINTDMTDEFGQPIDLRQKNTWREKIDEVSLQDCLSTQIINSTVPFYITGQLKSIMGGEVPSYVINVSSMEGVFYRDYKSCFHPHTNMAKASLNMITRTCAQDFAKQNIFMNSVDTGWVTNENPINIQLKMKLTTDFAPPLDCIEGAMRCIDPIYEGVRNKNFIYGKFLKDYAESKW